MSNVPDIALCIVTYQRPRNLAMVLESIAVQQGVRPEQMELVVSDDGSTDETPKVVEDFGRRVSFPVKFITHQHLTFQAARCRNAAAAATKAPICCSWTAIAFCLRGTWQRIWSVAGAA